MDLKRKIAKDLINFNPHRTLDVASSLTPSDKTIKNDLQYLDKKLDIITRQVNAWDMYNIVGSVDSLASVSKQLASLNINSGLVMNVKTTQYGKGDVVIRTSDGYIVAKADAQGLYYPSGLTGSNSTYTLTYSYSSVEPSSETGVIGDGIAKTLTTPSITLATGTAANTYAVTFTNPGSTAEWADSATVSALGVKPVIKAFTSKGEIVECELTVIVSGTTVQVSNIPAIVSEVILR